MSKEEITNLKEEFLSEIRNLEKRLNLQVNIKLKELNDVNDKFIQECKMISKNNKSLTDLLSTKNLDSHKIQDLEIFKKKTETMVVSHDIRLNTAIKDINELKFNQSKILSENLTVPGFVGPSCKYKSISNYIALNITDIDKLKNETESNKKENKEIKRKIEDMIKTVLNLVDKSNEKSIGYINNKMKNLEELMINKFDEVNDKMFKFKAVLLTQDKIDDIKKSIFDEIKENNYNKEEIDKIVNNILENISKDLNKLDNEIKHEMNKIINSKTEKYENEIKKLIKYVKETNMKIIKSNEFQSKLFKEFLSFKNSQKNNNKNESEEKNTDFNFTINRNIFSSKRIGSKTKISLAKSQRLEEEKIGKIKGFQSFQSFEKNKTLDMVGESKYKNPSKFMINDKKKNFKNKNRLSNDEKIKEKNNSPKNINKNIINENIMNEHLIYDDSSDIDDKENNKYITIDHYKLNISMDDKSNISIDNKSNKSNKSFNDINEDNTNIKEDLKNIITPEKKEKSKKDNKETNEIQLNSDTKKEEQITHNKMTNNTKSPKNANSIFKKDNQKIILKKQKVDFSNVISYGMNNNNKVIITPIEQNIKKEETNSILQIFQDTNSSIKSNIFNNNINNMNKTIKKSGGGYSLYKLADIAVEERNINNMFPSVRYVQTLTDINKNFVKPYGNRNPSSLYQSYDSKMDKYDNNYKTRNIINKKISSAFGRTSYTIYNKKEEGIRNLMNKRFNSNNYSRYKNKPGNFNFELSPVAKIKIYE